MEFFHVKRVVAISILKEYLKNMKKLCERKYALLPQVVFLAVSGLIISCAASKPFASESYATRSAEIKRISIVVREAEEMADEHLSLFGQMAFLFIDAEKDLIVYEYKDLVRDPFMDQLCETDGADLDALLFIIPRHLKNTADGVEVAATASLVDCAAKKILWSCRAGSTYREQAFDSRDLEARMAKIYGAKIVPYVGPVRMLVWSLLEELAEPQLSLKEDEERDRLHRDGRIPH